MQKPKFRGDRPFRPPKQKKSKAQKEKFESTVYRHTMVHEQLRTFFQGFRRDAHPMAILCGVVGALSAFYHDSLEVSDEEQREMGSTSWDRPRSSEVLGSQPFVNNVRFGV